MNYKKIGKIAGIVIAAGIILYAIYFVYSLNQKVTQAQQNVTTLETYLSAGIQLGVFPSGQQLQGIAQQKASSTK